MYTSGERLTAYGRPEIGDHYSLIGHFIKGIVPFAGGLVLTVRFCFMSCLRSQR